MGSRRAVRVASAGFAFGLCLSLYLSQARADEPDAGTRVAARELAVSGAEAFERQDFTTALDYFLRAESLYKVPSISVMLARSYVRVGRVVEAIDKYEETLRVPLGAGAPEAFQRAVADAAIEVDAARAKLARLELRLPADAPPDTRVTLDDRLVPIALVGVPTPVNPGPHRITATAAGRAPFSGEVVLPEGGRETVQVSFEAPAPAAPANTNSSGPAATPRRHASTLSIVLLAGGGVALAAGAVTGVAAMNHKSSLDAACSPGCPPSMSGDLSSFRRDRALSYLGLGLGLAAAGTGAYLLFHEGAAGSQVGALILPGGAAVSVSF